MMQKSSKIYVAGHRGLAGSAIMNALTRRGHDSIITRTHREVDLTNQNAVKKFFEKEKPEFVFLAAARVGGIMDNKNNPGDFIYNNLMIQNNVIHHAYLSGVKKLLFLGSSCVYPKIVKQPISEESLLIASLEPTNQAYAVAKIAGIEMCQAYNKQYGTNYISIMPTNLYGPGDNFDPVKSHVLPSFIRTFQEAKEKNLDQVTFWGTGKPLRELMYIDEFADASVFLMNNYSGSEIINVGTGLDISIKNLAEITKKIVGYKGKILWDTSKPDGTPRKLLDVTKLNKLGWKSEITLEEGIRVTYQWYMDSYKN